MYSRKLVCLSVIFIIISMIALCGCKPQESKPQINAKELTASFDPNELSTSKTDDSFKLAAADFSVRAFAVQTALDNADGNNTMLPVAALYNSFMLMANGTAGDMGDDFNNVLCSGKSPSEFNSHINAFMSSITDGDSGLSVRSSVWINSNVKASVKEEFLQTVVDYYQADIYKLDFADKNASKEPEKWFEFYSGSSGKAAGKVSKDSVMYLAAISDFSADWETPINPDESYDGAFAGADGKRITTPFMISEEEHYISDPSATGFVKDYKGGKFKFVALLPNDNMGVTEYLKSLDGKKYLSLMENISDKPVLVRMPKFSGQTANSQSGLASRLGLDKAFDKKQADFTKIMREEELTYLSDIRFFSDFSVNELGSGVSGKLSDEAENTAEGFKNIVEREKVTFDRPFVYMVIDNATNLPVLMGTVVSL